MCNSQRFLGGFLALLIAGPVLATTVTLDVDFESPTFSVGPIGGIPLYAAGQGGWGGYAPGSISSNQAHSGTQSLQTAFVGSLDYGTALKALDASGGEYPFGVGNFSFGAYTDWWVQAWVRVAPGGSGARMGLMDGPCPYVHISGSGTPTVEPCIAGQPPVSYASEGADVLDQWVLLRMVHTTSMFQSVEISITGDNVNFSITTGYSGPPGVSTASYITLSGDAYWDDVSAGYGAVPAVVPLPAAGWLLASGLASLAARRRRRMAP